MVPINCCLRKMTTKQRNKAVKLIIRCIDQHNNILQPDLLKYGYKYSDYSVSAPDLAAQGYLPIASNVVTGCLNEKQQRLTFVYRSVDGLL
ncbi:hypothetical protein [Loigolactobacillus jiayinensis]|uniref:Uncharacterized protein n=1 Tax=Loigolactobacillus jiayinensis TaxID=2486016 RepID=A0ABW1REZ5_9LACO|nr:hypothetical protein [Loigolactobacillus jiayinensis]